MQDSAPQSVAERPFFSTLFDFSFQSWITLKIIPILYGLGLLGVALYTLFIIAAAFNASGAAGIVVLILSPLIFLIGAIFARVYMELIIVLFKVAENTANIDANTKRG